MKLIFKGRNILLLTPLLASAFMASPLCADVKLRLAVSTVAHGAAISWVTADKGIWRKYGLDVEIILIGGGGRTVTALVSDSVQFLIGSDTGATTAMLQGLPLVRLGVTANQLGSSLFTQPGIESIKALKGKVLGISRGRDTSYAQLAKLLRDHGVNPNEDVKFLPLGGQEARLSALKTGVIHGTLLFLPFDLIGKNEGMKILAVLDVPTPNGGMITTTGFLKQNRRLALDLLKGYMEGIHYMLNHKEDSLQVLAKYYRNSDLAVMRHLYDEITRTVEKDLRPNPESVRYHLEMAALDDPRAKRLSEKDFWDSSLVDEIRRSGFVEQLYKK